MSKIICPECGEEITNRIRAFQSGNQIYAVRIQNGDVEYENDEFESMGGLEFYCGNCSKTIAMNEKDLLGLLS